MVCKNCHRDAFHIKIIQDGAVFKEYCNNCAVLGSGPKIDGILTRNSFRIRTQQHELAKDMIQPHAYDKHSRKLEVNPEFIKHYPHMAYEYFTERDLKRAGLPKMIPRIQKQQQARRAMKEARDMVQYEGDAQKGIKKILTSLPHAKRKRKP